MKFREASADKILKKKKKDFEVSGVKLVLTCGDFGMKFKNQTLTFIFSFNINDKILKEKYQCKLIYHFSLVSIYYMF